MVQLMSPTQAIFWKQVQILTLSNLKSRYRRTIAGFFWVLINPLVLFGVQAFVFSKVLKIDVPHFPVFLLSGLIPWIFISQSCEMVTPVLSNSGAMIRAFPAHPLIYVASQLFDNAINFFLTFAMILFPVLILTDQFSHGLWFTVFPLATLVVGVLGLTSLLAMLQVFLRDTRYVISFVLSVFFFLTPIFYPVENLPEMARPLVRLNIFYILIEPIRISIYSFQWENFLWSWMRQIALSIALLAAAGFFWKKCSKKIYFHL
ncbi:MAG: ABC transporter permease [Bdellovibrionales bacterium]|nr:ABC transporter permease [Bdellovibrionales bacterium]